MEKKMEKEVFVIKGEVYEYNGESGYWHWKGNEGYTGYTYEEMNKRYWGERIDEIEEVVRLKEKKCEEIKREMRETCLRCKILTKCNTAAMNQEEIKSLEEDIDAWRAIKKKYEI